MSILVGLGYLLIVGFSTLAIRESNRVDKRRKIFDEIIWVVIGFNIIRKMSKGKIEKWVKEK